MDGWTVVGSTNRSRLITGFVLRFVCSALDLVVGGLERREGQTHTEGSLSHSVCDE